MAEAKYTVRNMTKEDVPKALEVWRETGLQEGKHSLYTWLEIDPEAFKIAVSDDVEVIGVCSAAIHHEDLVFLGFYCVREKYRGLGIGFKLWSACLEHIGDKNACLYAVPEMKELYQTRGGFPIVESEWACFGRGNKLPVNTDVLTNILPNGVSVDPFEESHLPLIQDYDSKLIGYDRHLVIKLTCMETASRTYLAVKNGKCVGYGVVKISCQENALIGPLYADDKEVAEVLLKKLILSLPQENGLSMVTMSNNDAANELAKRIGFDATPHEYPMLYRKKLLDIDIDPNKVYALFDLCFCPY